MNRTSLLMGTALLSAAFIGTTSNLAQDSGSTAQSASPKVDFAYRLGHTTLDEARAHWSQNGMKVVGAGHMALGGGSGMDRVGKVSAEKVLLVDVSGVDFEGISNARFGFYDNMLYRIQATLTPILLKGSTTRSYTDEEMKALGIALRKKYGTPSREQRTMFADKKSGNDVLIWNLPTGKLTLTAIAINGSLILSDEKMEADVRGYIKSYCKTINTPGHIVCW
jgi:hypothetical protein